MCHGNKTVVVSLANANGNASKTAQRYAPALLVTAVLVIPCAVFAQGSGSSLSGLITDNSQAVVPGAIVKAKQLATNVTSETASAVAGYYRFPSLPIGEYEVTVDHAGFAQATGRVLIETARETRQYFILAVAGTTEALTVAAAESQLSFG